MLQLRSAVAGVGIIQLSVIRNQSCIPSSFLYKLHFSKQLNYWSLRCSWSTACRRCSNYIFGFTPGLNILRKDNCKPRRESFKFWDSVRLILETWRYVIHVGLPVMHSRSIRAMNMYDVSGIMSVNQSPQPHISFCVMRKDKVVGLFVFLI